MLLQERLTQERATLAAERKRYEERKQADQEQELERRVRGWGVDTRTCTPPDGVILSSKKVLDLRDVARWLAVLNEVTLPTVQWFLMNYFSALF